MLETKSELQIIGDVFNKLSPFKVEQELLALKTFPNIVPYPEDAFGLYRTYPLWNHLGDSLNGNTYYYNGIPKITDIGNKLSHISAMIIDTFNINYLKVCRINEFLSGTFLVPHVDYLDGCQSKEKFFRRIHIPLKTQKQCWNSYESEVYHMQFGEIWIHDSYCCHSAGNFSSESRFHLILDVDPKIPLKNLFKDKAVFNSIHKLDPIYREPFTNSDLDDILALAKLINPLNFKEIVSLLSKIHFYKKVSSALTYDWLEKIAKITQNTQLIEKARMTKQYFVGPRTILAGEGASKSENIPQFQFF